MDLVELESYVKRGSNRKKVFLALEGSLMPSELVLRLYSKMSNTRFNIVSRALAELVQVGLVRVKNPKEKTGRLYELTPAGKNLKKIIS